MRFLQSWFPGSFDSTLDVYGMNLNNFEKKCTKLTLEVSRQLTSFFFPAESIWMRSLHFFLLLFREERGEKKSGVGEGGIWRFGFGSFVVYLRQRQAWLEELVRAMSNSMTSCWRWAESSSFNSKAKPEHVARRILGITTYNRFESPHHLLPDSL